MFSQSSCRFLQSLLRFIGAAFLLTLILIVQLAMLTLRASAHSGGAQTFPSTTLTPTPSSSSVFGQTVTFTATASCSAGCHNANLPHNLGINVQFFDGVNLIGSSAVGGNTSSQKTPSFSAAFQYANLLVGTHTINAVFTPADPAFTIPNATTTQTVSP